MSKRSGVQAGSWAERLARGRLPGGAAPREEAARAAAALAALWDLFDQTCSQANEALGAFGIAEGITLREEGNLRRFCATGSDGTLRFIAILPLLRGEGGEAAGAYIGTSSTRATMYLVPAETRRRVVWRVAVSGRPFDADVVHDL